MVIEIIITVTPILTTIATAIIPILIIIIMDMEDMDLVMFMDIADDEKQVPIS